MTLDRFLAIAGSAASFDAFITSVLAGVAFGALAFGQTAALLRIAVGSRDYAFNTALTCGALGAVFFLPTLASAIRENDEAWPRIVVRLGFWLLFSASLGVGIKVRVWWAMRRLRNHRLTLTR